MSLNADKVSGYIEDDVRVLAFAEGHSDDPKVFVILSRTEFPEGEEDDDGVYIDSSYGCNGYNLVELVEVGKDFIVIRLLTKLKADLKISFDDKYDSLVREYIDKLFGK